MISPTTAPTPVRREKQLAASVRKAKGAHYTPQELAVFVAEQITANLPQDKRSLKILDPACGDGSLLHAMAGMIGDSDHCFEGCDIDSPALVQAEALLRQDYRPQAFTLRHEDFLTRFEGATGDLFQSASPSLYDAIISNPPYVRTQVLGAAVARRLAAAFGHSGRIDLYFAFLVGISLSLKPGGVAGIIVSNRFMTTKAGSDVRAGLLRDFDLIHVWDLGDTKLFEAAVLPAVLILRKKSGADGNGGVPGFTSIYSTNAKSEAHANSAIEALTMAGPIHVNGSTYAVTHGTLELRHAGDVWRLANSDNDAWLETVRFNTYRTFGEIGKIRVGVKTTADNVFIGNWAGLPEAERPELLRPLITHHAADRFRADLARAPRQILYTHEVRDGKRAAIPLAGYPISRSHLDAHREQLEGRRYVIEAKREWYEIWVPQNPASWQQSKLVFTDISERPTCWIDTSGAVVNGDCYWMIPTREEDSDLLWLALAVGNSSFIETFYDHKFNNKLYAGRRRFMTQYVEQFPIPNPTTPVAEKLIYLAKEIHRRKPAECTADLERECDTLVKHAFGVAVEELAG